VIRARRRFGQHFLEPSWADKLVKAIAPRPDEVFVEIGPGRGALTIPLAARCAHVIAYEIDRDLASELRARAPGNVGVVEGDFLDAEIDLSDAPSPPAGPRVAGNLPYNVASPILFKLVEMYLSGVAFRDATVMLQREVADRLLAEPGTKEYGVLTVLMGHTATVTRLLNLPPGAFRPPPKVLSSVVRLRFHPPDPPVKDREVFTKLVQAVFTRRRKTLGNALQAFAPAVRVWCEGSVSAARVRVQGQSHDAKTGVRVAVDPGRRPETLTVAEFAGLADVFSSR